MLSGIESCIKRIKTFESKRPKNRLALKKAYIWAKTDIIMTFIIKKEYLFSMRVFCFTLSKSTSLYDLNLILSYRMFVVIWLFFAKPAAYKFVPPRIAWIPQRRRNSSWQYFYTSLGFPHPVWRQGAFSTRLWILWCTIMFYSQKADVFIHRLRPLTREWINTEIMRNGLETLV